MDLEKLVLQLKSSKLTKEQISEMIQIYKNEQAIREKALQLRERKRSKWTKPRFRLEIEETDATGIKSWKNLGNFPTYGAMIKELEDKFMITNKHIRQHLDGIKPIDFIRITKLTPKEIQQDQLENLKVVPIPKTN